VPLPDDRRGAWTRRRSRFEGPRIRNTASSQTPVKFMKPARMAILGVALSSGLLAGYLSSIATKPETVPPAQAKVVEVAATDVLVAATDLPLGAKLGASGLRWLPWPANGLSSTMILKSEVPDAIAQFTGSMVRDSFVGNEPIRREKLIKADSGFLAAILPEGKRAFAISIDQRGSNSAGTLILPNDHVDVISIFKDWKASKSQDGEVYSSEILLQNIRVLAIGPNIEERNGARVAVGETATLELDPEQGNAIALAQRTGSLALALRSVADASALQPARVSDATATVSIVRGLKREEYVVLQNGDASGAPRSPAIPDERSIVFSSKSRAVTSDLISARR
jgi:pilus assembly protein CpaB